MLHLKCTITLLQVFIISVLCGIVLPLHMVEKSDVIVTIQLSKYMKTNGNSIYKHLSAHIIFPVLSNCLLYHSDTI